MSPLLQTADDLTRLEAIEEAAFNLETMLFEIWNEARTTETFNAWFHAAISSEKAAQELAEAEDRMRICEGLADSEGGVVL
jgi:hypothetical protein